MLGIVAMRNEIHSRLLPWAVASLDHERKERHGNHGSEPLFIRKRGRRALRLSMIPYITLRHKGFMIPFIDPLYRPSTTKQPLSQLVSQQMQQTVNNATMGCLATCPPNVMPSVLACCGMMLCVM